MTDYYSSLSSYCATHHYRGGVADAIAALSLSSWQRCCHRGAIDAIAASWWWYRQCHRHVATAREVSFEAADARAMPTDGDARAGSEYVVLRGDSE